MDWRTSLKLKPFRKTVLPAPVEQIEEAVGVALPDDYRSFLQNTEAAPSAISSPSATFRRRSGG